MTVPQRELVAAVAANGVIGRGGQIPWHLPDDLRHFKELTMGHTLVMGRRTFESIGRSLPGRRSIVVSQTLSEIPPGTQLARSLDDALRLAAHLPGRAFVIGGAALYAAALPQVRLIHLTMLDVCIEGDTFFPPTDRSDWRLVSEVRHEPDDRHMTGFRFCTYEQTFGGHARVC
jgi:dihydrofolate reductase